MYGMSSSNVARLQRAQNATALGFQTAINKLVQSLHWLLIESRIKFKIACITYKTVSTVQPAYLHSVLKQYAPSRRLRSLDCSLLAVPRARTCFGSRSFAVAAPTTWNSLTLHIRNSSSIYGFRPQLETFLYKLAFDPF